MNAPKVKVYDEKAERLLFDALKQRARGRTELVKVTRADAVALTGMPADQAEPALKSLVKSYRSHMAVTEEGELVYEFDPSLERRDKVPLRDKLAAVGDKAWRGFQLLFKIWIVATLVIYVVAFVAMMISLMVAKQNDRDDRRGGDGFGFPWIWWWLMPDLAPPGYYNDRYGRPLQQRRPRPQKRFYQSVFDFVFGPKGKPVDPRQQDKLLLAFLREHKGRMAASELSALTGLSLTDADEELTRLMAEYDGEVEVAGDGTLIYVFDELLPTAEGVRGSWSYVWDQRDEVAPLTGNTAGANAVTAGFAGFNLLASFTIGPAFLQRVHLSGDPTATFFVTLFPLIFSAVFFAVPALRALKRRRALARREQRQLRRALLREIWAAPSEPRDPDVLAALAAKRAAQPTEASRKLLDELTAELDGDVTTDKEGAVRYVFPRLAEERQAVAEARRVAEAKPLGRVVFSSDGEGEGEGEGEPAGDEGSGRG